MRADFEKGVKVCSRCKAEKSLDAFSKNRAMKDGLTHNCRECSRHYAQESSYERDPQKQAAYMREHHRKYKYGLTSDQVDEMLIAQNGSCAICHKRLEGTIDIDHNHDTGNVRGLLCRSCNVAIGLFQDDPEILINAVQYLMRDSLDLRHMTEHSAPMSGE